MEGLKGAELWGEHRDAAQRECLTDLRRNAKSCFAFLPPGQCPVLSRLLNNLPPTLKPVLDRREKGTTPSDEQILRAIQGISTVKFEIPTRHFSEISALEVGVGYGLDGFFKISNRIGTKGTFYFSSLDFNSPEDFEDWLKESLYVFAYDPADLVEALDEKSCDRRSKFPKLESESAVKAYRRVGDLAKIILDCSLPLDTVVQPLCVDRKENGFRMSLITRPELELDILVTSAGIQGLEVRFPRLRSWEVQRGASNKLNFSIDPSSDFSETELLGLIAEIGKVRTPAGFRKTSVRSYLRKHSYLG